MQKVILYITLSFTLNCFFVDKCFAFDKTQFVNPFIGTQSGGNTNPGAVLPWGMMSAVPFNGFEPKYGDQITQNFGPSSYVSGRKYISGFNHGSVSGAGCPALGILTIMPTNVNNSFQPQKYLSPYSTEIAQPGFYKVHLDTSNITAELTVTKRCAIHRYTFPKGEHSILLNLGLSLNPTKGAMIRSVSENEFEGYHTAGAFCNRLISGVMYFYIKIQKQPDNWGMWNNNRDIRQFTRENVGNELGLYLRYKTNDLEQVLIKVGISYTSIANAKLNLEMELHDWDFNSIRKKATDEWEKQLGRIQIEDNNRKNKEIFYTALYHSLLQPNILNDVNGDYPAYKSLETNNTNGQYDRYTVFSLWDTYRTLHPLLSLVYPERQLDMVKSMLAMYDEGGWLPKWEINSQESYVMVGDPASTVIVDSYLRGIDNFDAQKALTAMLKSANTPESQNPLRPGIDSLKKYGYIPQDSKGVWGPLSTTQEYGIADWNIAQFAAALGEKKIADDFKKRSLLYRNYFDAESKFLRPRNVDGSFIKDFKLVLKGNLWPGNPGFVEGDAWQYLFFPPHDISWLKKSIGGDKKFLKKLDAAMDSAYFIMENEPDMHYPYLYNAVKGQEWKTQYWVNNTIQENFETTPNGLPGNDDCGTISAWVVFSMMGIYPTCPGNLNYELTSPIFDKVTIKLHPDFYKGNEFSMISKNRIESSIFIKSMKLNDNNYSKFNIHHSDIVIGGTLEIIFKK